MGVSAAGRAGLGNGGGDAAERARAEVAVSMQLTARWWHAEVAGGIASAATAAVPTSGTGQLRVRAFPARAALGVPVGGLGGTLLPTVGLNMDVLTFRAEGLRDARSGVVLEPAAELALGYRRSGPRLFVRGVVAGGLTLGARDFDAGIAEPVFRTPAGYFRALLELGLLLWKN